MKKSRLSLLLLPFILSSCSKEPTLELGKFFAFNAFFEISAYNIPNSKVVELEDEILKYSDYFDAFNAYKNINNIYTINSTNEEVILDEFLYDALKEADSYFTKTKGYFNPYLGEITYAYKDSYEENKLPTEEIINRGLENLKTFDLVFNDAKKSVKRQGNSKIDLGGFAKGYSIEMAKKKAKELGITNYLISGGGSSNYFTTKPEGKSFKAGFRDIKDSYVEIKNNSLGVSSIFEQYVVIDNVKYSHIINPFTGKPSMIYDLSVILNESATLTDVFSTVLMVVEDENIIKEFAKNFNFDYLIYKDNKVVYQSEGIKLIKR